MPAGARCLRPREIMLEMRIEGVGDVAIRKSALAPFRASELEAAVDDGPLRLIDMFRQLERLDQRREHGVTPGASGPRASCPHATHRHLARQALHFRPCVLAVTIAASPLADNVVAIEVWWGSGSPYAWRVLLALELKRLPYVSHLLQFSKQEHKSPHMLALNPRGRVPVLRDGDYVCFESLAILYYLDLKYPQPGLFGRSPEEAGTIMRVICEYQAYIEPHVTKIARAVFFEKADLAADEITAAMQVVASEARTIEGRLSKSEWIVGDSYSAADMVLFPGVQLLIRALNKPRARELSSRFMPVEVNYPALGRWLARVAATPGYERTYPPHWRES